MNKLDGLAVLVVFLSVRASVESIRTVDIREKETKQHKNQKDVN